MGRRKRDAAAILYELGIEPLNEGQVKAWKMLLSGDYTAIALRGVVGSGKTGLAVWTSVARMVAGEFTTVAYTRPPVPKGPSLGALPGGLGLKFAPWLRGWYANAELIAPLIDKLPDKCKIEFPTLEHIKGDTLRNTILIVDEAQDLLPDEAEALLGRLASGSQVVFCGDVSQIDRKSARPGYNGLDHIQRLAERPDLFPDFGWVELTEAERGRGAEMAAYLSGLRRGEDNGGLLLYSGHDRAGLVDANCDSVDGAGGNLAILEGSRRYP